MSVIKNMFNIWYKPKKDKEVIYPEFENTNEEFIIVQEKDHEIVKKIPSRNPSPPILPSRNPTPIPEEKIEEVVNKKEDKKEEVNPPKEKAKKCLLCLSCIVMVFLFYKKWRK